MDNIEIADFLGCPQRLVNEIKEKKFIRAITTLRRLMVMENISAESLQDVWRIHKEFKRIFGQEPYRVGTPEDKREFFDAQIAMYIDKLGVGAMVRSMENTSKTKNIRSIVFFLYSRGQTSVWEKLFLDKDSRKIQLEPQWVLDERENYKKLRAEMIGKNMQNGQRTVIMKRMNRIREKLEVNGFKLNP